MGQRWEYLEVIWDNGKWEKVSQNHRELDHEDLLNELGNLQWELVSVTKGILDLAVADGTGDEIYTIEKFFFKRPLKG